MSAATDIAARVAVEQQARLDRAKRPQAWAGWRASGLGDECERRIFLWRTAGEHAAEISDGLAALFSTGTMLHPVIRRLLSEMGIEVTAAETSFPKNDYGITGTVDGMVGNVVAEIKTCAGATYDKIESAADLKAMEGYARRWYSQVQIYMFLADVPEAVLILYDKWGGRLKAIPIPFDAGEAEKLTDRAVRLNAALASGEPPDFINDPATCRRCPFWGRKCSPPVDYGEGAKILTDEILIQDLARRQELSAAASEYDRIDKSVKARLKDIPMGVAGDFLVQGKAVTRKEYTVAAGEYWKVDIKPLNGNGETT